MKVVLALIPMVTESINCLFACAILGWYFKICISSISSLFHFHSVSLLYFLTSFIFILTKGFLSLFHKLCFTNYLHHSLHFIFSHNKDRFHGISCSINFHLCLLSFTIKLLERIVYILVSSTLAKGFSPIYSVEMQYARVKN